MPDQPIPSDVLQTVEPPKELLDSLESKPLCGGRVSASWASGPMRGQRTTAYCAEPPCINTGYCTGAKFVAHTIQHDSNGEPRKLSPLEIVPVARYGAEYATGKDDPRSDREIMHHALKTYQRMAEAIKGRT